MDAVKARGHLVGFAAATAGIVLLTAAFSPFRSKDNVLIEGLLFLLLTLLVSAKWGRAAGIFTAVASNVCVNFFFVEPLHRLDVAEPRNVLSLGIFLLVSMVGSSLVTSAREAASEARRGQAQTEVLLRLSREMIGQPDAEAALDVLVAQLVEAFQARGAAVLSPHGGRWQVLTSGGSADAGRDPSPEERSMADRALQERSIQGAGATGLRTSRIARIVGRAGPAAGRGGSLILTPLMVGEASLGVLRLDGPVQTPAFREHPEDLLVAFGSEAALTLQRLELARAAARTEVLEVASEAKTSLMMSISHDLKTPLAAIKTSVSSLLDQSVSWPAADVRAFLETIDSQADHLNRAISDILDLNRIESGAVRPLLKEVQALELLEDAAERCAQLTQGREVTVHAPADLRLVVDQSLAVHALVNLIDNASKYSVPTGAIHLSASAAGDVVELLVEDEGPGIPADALPRVFDRFYRLPGHDADTRGSGLGLALVKAFTTLSGGSVRVASGPEGSRFALRFPAASRRRSIA